MLVVVVESPAKAKTINKYLGSGYTVLASYGHVRDLPAKDGSVDPDDDFPCLGARSRAAKRISAIAEAVKGADKLILATDPDREGEAISWHVLEVLQRKGVLKGVKTVERVVFNADHPESVLDAMRHPREIDGDLVEAYLARRALDYLVGFTLSPVLWRKLPGARSAGRVQSVALRLICDRELEIEAFGPGILDRRGRDAAHPAGARFEARLVGDRRQEARQVRLDIPTKREARQIEAPRRQRLQRRRHVESKPAKRHPQPPFTTSTLQQEASRKLGCRPAAPCRSRRSSTRASTSAARPSASSPTCAPTACRWRPRPMAPRNAIGRSTASPICRRSRAPTSTKAKNAQEAHEAIRPTDLFRFPERALLSTTRKPLYELIWKRTVASQMEAAELERTTVDIDGQGKDGKRYGCAPPARWCVRRLPRLYQEGRDDEDDEERTPPAAMARGDR
jgi:DNA topoisomerase I